MHEPTTPGALPLRPMTTGELLDAAMALLRTRAPLLLGVGLLLAFLEQAALFQLRTLADLTYVVFPNDERWGWFWLVLLTVPLGPLAFLLAGGPTSRTVVDQEQEGRLTGGWAFLLALLVGSVLGTVR